MVFFLRVFNNVQVTIGQFVHCSFRIRALGGFDVPGGPGGDRAYDGCAICALPFIVRGPGILVSLATVVLEIIEEIEDLQGGLFEALHLVLGVVGEVAEEVLDGDVSAQSDAMRVEVEANALMC